MNTDQWECLTAPSSANLGPEEHYLVSCKKLLNTIFNRKRRIPLYFLMVTLTTSADDLHLDGID